jgi:NAD(P)-dependent dehydrogenase (short-subunit alcohol dehydrogenase family)
MRLLPVEEQVVVVMGASSGIGRATALCFARRGARVVVAARSADGLESLVCEIRQQGGHAVPVVADVANAEQVKRVAQRAIVEYGRIDTWVHVAAVCIWAPFERTRPEEWRRLLDVNLLGQVHGAQAALPHLRARGGALIHVSSAAAKVALPLMSAYSASKHGISGFVDALRLELRREGTPVSVTQIMPAGVDTPLFRNGLTRLGVEPRPAAPAYDPEIVARAIVYAASHPVQHLVVGGVGALLLGLQRFLPGFLNELLLRQMGFEAHLTNKPKSDAAPNAMFAPSLEANHVVRGDVAGTVLSRSIVTRLQQSIVARMADGVLRVANAIGARVASAVYVRVFQRSLVPEAREPEGAGSGLPATVLAEARREGKD